MNAQVSSATRSHARRQTLTIGVVNNMPAAARRATMRQFQRLLDAAATEHDVDVKFYRAQALGVADSEAEVCGVFDARCDGLIVTGSEPQTARLSDDPVRALVGRLVDWAEDTATPVIWSCLAAHAACCIWMALNGCRSGARFPGSSGRDPGTKPPLMDDVPGDWRTPHSRHNSVSEALLRRHGYEILVWSEEVGVDLFERRSAAPFLFLQSHPEYDADTLAREFQRDLKRFDLGERPTAPLPPVNYSGEAPWRPVAVVLYRNWLRDLADRKVCGLGRGLIAPAMSPLLGDVVDCVPC